MVRPSGEKRAPPLFREWEVICSRLPVSTSTRYRNCVMCQNVPSRRAGYPPDTDGELCETGPGRELLHPSLWLRSSS